VAQDISEIKDTVDHHEQVLEQVLDEVRDDG